MERWKAILSVQILVAITLVVSAFYGGKFWEALTAIGTIGAVGVALYLNPYLEHKKRPIIKLALYESSAPHLRQTPRFNRHNGQQLSGCMYPISVGVTNIGGVTAKNASIVASQVWTYKDNKWEPQPAWIPAPIEWALDERTPNRSDIKNLVPHRPYVFNLALLDSESSPDFLRLRFYMSPGNQPELFPPGHYCLEVMICAEGIGNPVSKYFYINWKGKASRNLTETQKQIEVRMEDFAPSTRKPEPATSSDPCYLKKCEEWVTPPLKEEKGSAQLDRALPSPSAFPDDEGCETEKSQT
jgi:hypothetical protein